MRFIVVGAGAIGGVVGGRLHQAGEDVVLVARGPHLEAIRHGGLRLADQTGMATLRVPVVGHPSEVTWQDGDVVILAVKSQQTEAALTDLALVAPPDTAIACFQNGVVNEAAILRRFANVYGVHVQCPAGYLEPGEVLAYSSPVTGMFDIGRYPDGVDDVAEEIAAALRGATCLSDPLPEIMRWKRRKLILNLANAAEALCGPSARFGELGRRARAEGDEVMAAAGLDVASKAEDTERRGDSLRIDRGSDGKAWAGGSSWQSLARATGDIEVDYLNGEIVFLGRLLGVDAPVNALLQRLARRAAAERLPPGTYAEADLLAQLDAVSTPSR
ncbi:MAG TPA: 2-dehydropantoate 2-reductase N-terminal domain-containing protein [Acidimicrobiales bacterium]